jgi:hypothetical protein
MKQIARLVALYVAFAMVFSLEAQPTSDKENELLEAIQEKMGSIESALEVRNFKDAKEQFEDLMPLMKKEMKSKKKSIHLLEKEGESAQATELQKTLDRTVEIQEQLSSLLGGSSAALRAKSTDAKSLIKEYQGLLVNDLKLLSSNN